MKYLLVDDSGVVRGIYPHDQGGSLFEVEGEKARKLVSVEDNDSRLSPPVAPNHTLAVVVAFEAALDGDRRPLDALKAELGA